MQPVAVLHWKVRCMHSDLRHIVFFHCYITCIVYLHDLVSLLLQNARGKIIELIAAVLAKHRCTCVLYIVTYSTNVFLGVAITYVTLCLYILIIMAMHDCGTR